MIIIALMMHAGLLNADTMQVNDDPDYVQGIACTEETDTGCDPEME